MKDKKPDGMSQREWFLEAAVEAYKDMVKNNQLLADKMFETIRDQENQIRDLKRQLENGNE